jgi:CRP/FNR family transcriptional regulator/CRP/FNR family cyclic AMP-dependent transcriptional regulator
LFHEGDVGHALYILRSGWVKIVMIAPDGEETLLQVHGPGGCVGEMSLLDGEPRCATAVALDRVEALLLYREEFLSLLMRTPRMLHSVIGRLTGMTRRLSGQIQESGLLDLRGRLARRLLDLAEQYGEPAPEGIRLSVRLTQQELAQMIGGTRSHVNRHLRRFQSQGILTVAKDGILIHRPEKLRGPIDGAQGCIKENSAAASQDTRALHVSQYKRDVR